MSSGLEPQFSWKYMDPFVICAFKTKHFRVHQSLLKESFNGRQWPKFELPHREVITTKLNICHREWPNVRKAVDYWQAPPTRTFEIKGI